MHFKQKLAAEQILLALAILTGSNANASDPIDLGAVGTSGTGTAKAGEADKGKAAAAAPTQSSLKATQPQSIISREFIEQSIAPTGDLNTIANLAPSASGTSYGGPGLSESKTTLRGFKDGEYNATFDGIPFGDTNNPTHHSTSYFPASVLGTVVVERGPGNASNFGQATFGGSINLFSKAPSTVQEIKPFLTFGTWNTLLVGIGYESGRMKDSGDATLQFNYQHLKSDTAQSNSPVKSDNVMVKYQRPLGDSTLLTFFITANDIKYFQPDTTGITLTQANTFGKNYQLNNDATSQGFKDYNVTKKQTDFEYVRLQSDLGAGFGIDNNLYSYYYKNDTLSGLDNTGQTANGTKSGATGNKNVPGYTKLNAYRVTGDIFKATKQFDSVLARFGVWLETAESHRTRMDVDLTLNLPDPRETKPTPVVFPSVAYEQDSGWKQYEPFAEFEWVATDGLTITPGIKLINFKRSINALVNQTTRLSSNSSQTYKTTLPFLTVNQQFANQWSAYFQYAKGFLTPDLNVQYVTNATLGTPEPQTSTNYQVGVIHQSDLLTWDVDYYKVDFKNKLTSTGSGATQVFINQGGVTYKGIEAQATLALGNGVALYANGSSNKATSIATGLRIGSAPDMTAALGILYNQEPWSASLIYKITGSQFAGDGEPAAYKIASYNNVDLNIGYTMKMADMGLKALKIQLTVNNLSNKQNVTSISPKSGAPLFDAYFFQAARSVMMSLKGTF